MKNPYINTNFEAHSNESLATTKNNYFQIGLGWYF